MQPFSSPKGGSWSQAFHAWTEETGDESSPYVSAGFCEESFGKNTGGPSARWEEIINVNEAHANVTLAFERCCVTKMRFTKVCMGTSRVCYGYLKFNVLWIKLTYLAFLSYSLLFHEVWGRFQAFSASFQWRRWETAWAACGKNRAFYVDITYKDVDRFRKGSVHEL